MLIQALFNEFFVHLNHDVRIIRGYEVFPFTIRKIVFKFGEVEIAERPFINRFRGFIRLSVSDIGLNDDGEMIGPSIRQALCVLNIATFGIIDVVDRGSYILARWCRMIRGVSLSNIGYFESVYGQTFLELIGVLRCGLKPCCSSFNKLFTSK